METIFALRKIYFAWLMFLPLLTTFCVGTKMISTFFSGEGQSTIQNGSSQIVLERGARTCPSN